MPRAGVLDTHRIQAIAKQRIAEGVGFIGDLYRIYLEYDEGAVEPALLIAKLPASEQSYRDLALMMGLYERELIRHYYDTLCAHGVTGYSFEQCWKDYRFAALALLIFMAVNQNESSLADLNERGQSLLMVMYERYSTAIVDLDALELCS